MAHKYLKRYVDDLLKQSLASSVLLIQDPDETQNCMKIADLKPSLLLQGETPRLIDPLEQSLLLRGKGSKERLVFITEKNAILALSSYLELRNEVNTPSPYTPFFPAYFCLPAAGGRSGH